MKNFENILTKKFLIKEYTKNKKSTLKIGQLVKCSYETVRTYLHNFQLPIRKKIKIDLKKMDYIEKGAGSKRFLHISCGVVILILLTIFLSGCSSYYKGFTPILTDTGRETTEGKTIYELFYIKNQ